MSAGDETEETMRAAAEDGEGAILVEPEKSVSRRRLAFDDLFLTVPLYEKVSITKTDVNWLRRLRREAFSRKSWGRSLLGI
jgi:hypothetical protein